MFYINAINGGGAARVILQLAHHFAEEGYKSILVTSFVDIDREYKVPENVIRYSLENEQLNESKLVRNTSRIKKLRKICKEEKPIVLISFMAEPNFRALIATRGLDIKRIVSVRNDPKHEYKGIIGRFVGKFILPQADGCVFQTEEARLWFPEKLQKKSKVIFNDVVEEFFNVSREKSEYIVTIGRLSKQKNHHFLIRSFARIASKYPNQELRIYGAGQLEESIRQQISNLGLDKQILLMGPTKNVAEVLGNAKMFVLSSDYEGMPNCLMEALAAGVPCISTDCPCGGPKMLIKSGENGILVPVGDEEAMANSIDRLLSDTQLSERIGVKARQDAYKFHPNRVFDMWKKYVENIAGIDCH